MRQSSDKLRLAEKFALRAGAEDDINREIEMLNKQNHENIKWELMDMSTKNMHRYLKESTIEKVLEVLDSEITFDELQDYAFDTRGE